MNNNEKCCKNCIYNDCLLCDKFGRIIIDEDENVCKRWTGINEDKRHTI